MSKHNTLNDRISAAELEINEQLDWYEKQKAQEARTASHLDAIMVANEAASLNCLSLADGQEAEHDDLVSAFHTGMAALSTLLATMDPGGPSATRPCGYMTSVFVRMFAQCSGKGVYDTDKLISQKETELRVALDGFNGSEVANKRIEDLSEYLESLHMQADLWADIHQAAQSNYVEFMGEEFTYTPFENRQANLKAAQTAASVKAQALLARVKDRQRHK